MKLLDAICYNGGKGPSDGNNYWRRFTAAHYAIASALLLAFGAWLALVLAALAGGRGVGEALETLLAGKAPLFPAAVLSVLFCLWFAMGRTWISALAVSIPLMAAALLYEPEAGAFAGQNAPLFSLTAGEIALTAGTGILGPALLALAAGGPIRSAKARIVGALASLAAAVAAVGLMLSRG